MTSLFDPERLEELGPHEFRRAVQRLMLHCGYEAFSIDSPGDGGGDLYCEGPEYTCVIQCKWKKRGAIGRTAFAEAREALYSGLYPAHRAFVATNRHFSPDAKKYWKQLENNRISVQGWDLRHLKNWEERYAREWLARKTLRPYQNEAIEAVEGDLRNTNKALLFLATGLGKTVVAGEIIRNILEKKPDAKILVLAHLKELVEQLQRALWTNIPINVPSQIVGSGSTPDDLPGLTVGTQLSIQKYMAAGYAPDLLVVDECHHVGEDNTYAKILSELGDTKILGVTATPWRGDGFDIEQNFGRVSYSCGIEEGMKKKYLSAIDYKLYSDNIDWDAVSDLSRHDYTLKDLNRRLFIAHRDEKILEALFEVWRETVAPKAIIFCQSIPHVKNMHRAVLRYEKWRKAEVIHSNMSPSERRSALTRFRQQDCPMLLAVDILNEGVDVPDVNIICFARVTHSRKIFVQQLGRGLRTSPGTYKEKVVVIDFAADIRRLAAIHNLKKSVTGEEKEEVDYHNRIDMIFEDTQAESLIEEWIQDAADLETAHDEYRLNYPSVP